MARTLRQYGGVAKFLHWAVAVLLLAALIYAWNLPDSRKVYGYSDVLLWHKSFGISVLVLIVLRLIWRVAHPVAPALTLTPFEAVVSRVTHALLYVTVLAMPLTGYLFSSLAGQHLELFGLIDLDTPFERDFALSRPIRAAHELGQWAIYVLVGLHAAAALYHQFIKRDGMLARMLPMARSPEGG